MPPPKRKGGDEEGSEDLVSEEPSSEWSGEEEEPVGKKKKVAAASKAKKATPKKRGTAAAAKQEAEGKGQEGEAGPPKKKRAAQGAAGKVTEPTTLADGWNVVPPSLLWKDYGAQPGGKIAAFDFDGTLVNPKGGSQFPRTKEDYMFFNKKVPKVIKELHEQGYKIVIFSNQGGVKSALDGKQSQKVRGRIDLVVEKELQVPAQALFATLGEGDPYRKPAPGMWNFFVKNLNGGVQPDLAASFYVGDAAGRAENMDWSDSDKNFAQAVGLRFRVPEDVFGDATSKRPLAPKAGGGGGGGAGADEAAAGPNTELVALFLTLADIAKASGEAKAHFKAAALRNAAQSLAAYPAKIATGNLGEVAKLPKVGKGSMELIKEYLSTGTIAEAGSGGGGSGAAAPPPPTKQQQQALAFM